MLMTEQAFNVYGSGKSLVAIYGPTVDALFGDGETPWIGFDTQIDYCRQFFGEDES
jgi:hypothetical protein